MPKDDLPSAVVPPKRPVTIALVGLAESEASYALQRLAVALPDAQTERFDDLPAMARALQDSDNVPVALLGSSLPDAERRAAEDLLRSMQPGVTVLDVDEWRGQVPPCAAHRDGDSLVAVAVRAALLERAVVDPASAVLNEPRVAEALHRDQLEVHYQPIVDLKRGDVVGLEALVRWRHPELGLLPPELFVPLAETSDLIVELGRWVLNTACSQAARWHRQGLRLELAVNVSVRQVTEPSFVQDVRLALEASGLDPQDLLLEVTESAVTEDVQAATAALTQIRATGAVIAIDDFGTGYSSLLHLKRYPIGALKVDRSFIAGLGRDPDDDAIVSSIVNLAAAVGALCIAEGVETPAQHEQLLALGCARAQGLLFSPPVPAAQVAAAVDAAEARTALAVREVPECPRRAPVEPVPYEVVEHVMRLRESGASYPTIAAALNQMGSLHPKGTRWHRTSVARLVADLERARQATS